MGERKREAAVQRLVVVGRIGCFKCSKLKMGKIEVVLTEVEEEERKKMGFSSGLFGKLLCRHTRSRNTTAAAASALVKESLKL
jgi:hypothetical protein